MMNETMLIEYAAARKRLKDTFPNASCTYFPMEQRYLAFNDYKQIGQFEINPIICIDKAIAILSQGIA